MSPWGSKPGLGLLGNPENRRIRDFQETAERLGWPRPPCLAYRDLLRNPKLLSDWKVEAVRIDSPGENEEVARELIALGGGPTRSDLEYGQIGYLREYHRGFCRVLEWVAASGLRCLNDPGEIAAMFDKQASHRRFVAAGLPRPEVGRELLERPAGRVFLKPLHGSSASGVCALRWRPGKRELFAALQIAQGRLFNSLKVWRYTAPCDIERILGELEPQGMICEAWIPKLTLSGGAVDLRVLVIAGEARHRVVRQSRHPMTNLHLGNRRAEESALLEAIGPERFEAALRLAERAAACFPASLAAGVDILLDTSHRALVGEINAFGDLLPGLRHRGETAYEALCRAQSCPV